MCPLSLASTAFFSTPRSNNIALGFGWLPVIVILKLLKYLCIILAVSRQIFTYFNIYLLLFLSLCIVFVVVTQEASNKIWESLVKIFLKRIWGKLLSLHPTSAFFWSLYIFQSLCTRFVLLGRTLENHAFSSNIFYVRKFFPCFNWSRYN